MLGTKYSITRLGKYSFAGGFAAKLGHLEHGFLHRVLIPFKCSGTTQFDYSLCLMLPIANQSKTTKQLYFCSTVAACLFIQMSLESVLLQLLIYDARQCWEGFKDVLEGPGGWCYLGCPGISLVLHGQL